LGCWGIFNILLKIFTLHYQLIFLIFAMCYDFYKYKSKTSDENSFNF